MPDIPVRILRNLSYSSMLSLHSCPRKYELKRSLPKEYGDDVFIDMSDLGVANKMVQSDATLAFGKAVGVGVQSWMSGKTWEHIYLDMFLEWDADFEDENTKAKKNFGLAMHAVDQFQYLQTLDIDIQDYELVRVPGSNRFATELGFDIMFPSGHHYRGFIDAVIRNKYTGEYLVLECKTTGATWTNAAKYQNSEQALSYALVLDRLFGKMASYGVLYTEYLTTQQKWETFYFPKNAGQRLGWFKNTMADIKTLESYIEERYFPTHGESCMAYNRPCMYLNQCQSDLSAYYIDADAEAKAVEKDAAKYDITIDVLELLDAQLED